MQNRTSPTATNQLIAALNSRYSNPASIKSFLQNGADPWAMTLSGSNVLDLCLRDGRAPVAAAWVTAARESLKKQLGAKNPLADLRVVDLVASSTYLGTKDRQDHLRKFLFSPHKSDDHHSFIRKMFTSRNPQIWPMIASMLLLRPQLHDLPVPHFIEPQADSNDFFVDDPDIVQFFTPQVSRYSAVLIDEFVAHAPHQVLFNYLNDRRHTVTLDWTKNPAIRDRLRLFLTKDWCHQWKDVPGFHLVFGGVDKDGRTPLHNYIADVAPQQWQVAALQILLEFGNRWDRPDNDGVTPWNMFSQYNDIPEDVIHLVHKQGEEVTSIFRPFA